MGLKLISNLGDTVFDMGSELDIKIKVLKEFGIEITDELLVKLNSYTDYFSLERFCQDLIKKSLGG